MTDDKPAPEGQSIDLEQRRRYPAPMIDLTATEVASASKPGASGSKVDPRSASSEGDAQQSPGWKQTHDPRSTSGDRTSGGGSGRMPPWNRWTRLLELPWRLIAAGVAGAAMMLVIVLAWSSISTAPRSDDSALADRLARIDAQIANLSARGPNADAGLTGRVAAAESALKSLTTDTVNLNGRVSEAADTARGARERAEAAAKAAAQAQTIERVRPAAIEPADLDALSARVTTLEKAVTGLQEQLGKHGEPGDHAARAALLATSLRLAVERGTGFAAELEDMKSVVKDPRVLSPLEPFAATGVPTPVVLSRELSALIPALLQSAKAPSSDEGFLARLEANAERLVRIRPIEEVPGDEPANVVLRIELKSRGDIAGALAEFAKLPPEARAPAETWIKRAESREAAVALARKLSVDALGALTPVR